MLPSARVQAIASYVQYFIAQHQAEKDGEVDTATAANLAAQLAYNNKNMLQAGLIVAGWDEQEVCKLGACHCWPARAARSWGASRSGVGSGGPTTFVGSSASESEHLNYTSMLTDASSCGKRASGRRASWPGHRRANWPGL